MTARQIKAPAATQFQKQFMTGFIAPTVGAATAAGAAAAATGVYVVAHSMGNLVLAGLDSQHLHGVKQVLCVAPDVNRVKMSEFVNTCSARRIPVTLYCSSRDWALYLSSYIRGGFGVLAAYRGNSIRAGVYILWFAFQWFFGAHCTHPYRHALVDTVDVSRRVAESCCYNHSIYGELWFCSEVVRTLAGVPRSGRHPHAAAKDASYVSRCEGCARVGDGRLFELR
jgi:Alpha/beta hydrolase of unknown function (DUF900)